MIDVENEEHLDKLIQGAPRVTGQKVKEKLAQRSHGRPVL
jgi:hypothetical protein